MWNTADDDYWWEQRLNAASFHQGQEDRKAGKEPQSVHPAYEMGYNDPEGEGVGAKASDESSEATEGETAPVVVRSWLRD